MPDQVFEYNSVSDFGNIPALILQASPEVPRKGRSIEISLPASEKDRFEALLDAYNHKTVQQADISALLTHLQALAADHYTQDEDGSFSLTNTPPSNRPVFANLEDALQEARNSERIKEGNLTKMKFMLDPEGSDQALATANEHMKQAGYADFSYLGSGTFTIAFRARETATNRTRIVKFSGWGGELQARGAPIPDNIKPVLGSPTSMPEDWLVLTFPEVLPLENLADEIGRGTRIIVNYKETGGEEEPEFYNAHGNIDIVHALFVNSMTEGYFASDTVADNVALMPDGGLKAYDMGMIAHRENPTLNTFDPKRAARHEDMFRDLGAPFHHVDHNGVPTDIAAFQPERYQEFLPEDFGQKLRAEL
ncbi:MAG: hypothetical protein H6858_03050 [Rhodospirillales bacterium]|nr:hypothetical protein [Rhodospirillales bacterium]